MRKDLIRVAAKEKGDRYYIPEKSCAKGHYLRSTSDGTCIECRKVAEKKRYYANPEKTKIITKAKYDKHAVELRVKRKQHYAMHKDDPIIKAEACAKSKRWRLANPNHANTKRLKKEYKLRNPHKTQAAITKYRVSKINRTPIWVDNEELWLIEEVYSLAQLRTKQTGFAWHVDHIIPLQGRLVSGLHVINNLQVIPWLDNIKKANRYEI